MADKFQAQYVADRLLGEGAFGKVYLIHNQRAEEFALKVMKAQSPHASEVLEREVRLLSRLKHPNLLAIHDFLPRGNGVKGVEEKGSAFIMEYVDGPTLEEGLSGLAFEKIEESFVQALRGLAYLHAHHLLHGDLKPSNLRMGKKHHLKILDFGLAGTLGEKIGEIVGTLNYLAPEALQGERGVRSDLFSLGAVFYQALTGRLPFDPKLELAQRFLIPPQPVETLHLPAGRHGAAQSMAIPKYFSEILGRLLEVNPANRFSSALGVIRALNRHSEKKYSLGEGKEVSPEQLPFMGRKEILAKILSTLEGEGEVKHPFWVIHGVSAVGKSRLLEEMGWQLKLRGMELEVFPDLHRAPEKTLDTLRNRLQELSVKRPTTAIALEWNDDFPNPTLNDFSRDVLAQKSAVELAVPPLDLEEIRDLWQEIFFEEVPSASFLERVQEWTEGRVGILVEVGRILKGERRRGEGGKGGRVSEFRSVGDLENAFEKISLPQSVKEWVERQWEGWSALEKKVLITLALLRGSYSDEVVAAIVEAPRELTQQALRVLQTGHWVQGASEGVSFLKKIFRCALLQLFGDSESAALRKRILQVLEARQLLDSPLLSELAWGAGERERFRHWGFKAAEELWKGGDPEAAVRLYHQLLGISSDRQEQAVIYGYLASVLSQLARWDEALEAYQRWYELREDDGTGLNTLKWHYLTGLVFFNKGDWKKAQQRFGQALQSGDSASYEHHAPFHLKVFSLLGRLYEQQGKLPLARQTYEQGLKLASLDSVEKTQLLRNLGLLSVAEHAIPQAMEYLQAALKLSRSLNYEEGITLAAFELANLAQRQGDYERALETYAQALELAEKNQEIQKMGRAHSNMASVLIEIADYGRAQEHAARAAELLEEGSELERLINRFHLMTLHTYLGDFSKAADPTWERWAERLKRADLLAFLERLRGEALRLGRDFKGALHAYERARGQWASLGEIDEFNLTLLLEVYTECLAGDLGVAEKKLKLWKSDGESQSNQVFYEWARDFLLHPTSLAASLAARMQELTQRAEQERVILALLAASEILLRHSQSEGASLLKQRAFEWLEGLYRSLPEEMQLKFAHREDFERLSEAQKVKHKGGGISRERFLTFAKINKRLSEEGDIPSILEQVMDAAMALAGAERGFLLVREDNEAKQVIDGYRVETARNMKKETIGKKEFKISLSVVAEAVRRRALILTDDARADPSFKDAESVHLYQLKSILALPLVGQRGCYGVLYLDHRFEVGAFAEEALVFLKAFADQAVLALEKAQAMAQLGQAKRALEARVVEQAHQIELMEVELSEARAGLKFGYEEIIGHSPKMIQILKLLDRITDTRVPVWIHGESGTGKELIARALHYNSDRKLKPFITENCSAIPENLLESVLFGHVKGAFTHADRDRMGLFEAAHGGTIFLDEIGDMPMPMQAKLLRVLQEGEVRRVGANSSVKVDVRVVSATNKNLPELVKRGEFREDLFFRLNGLRINLPPLRERKEDIPLLVQHFIEKVAKENNLKPCLINQEALNVLAQFDWPGNIRELENAVRNAVIFAEGKTVTKEALGFKPELFVPAAQRPKVAAAASEISAASATPLNPEREAILDALVRASFHKGETAKELKVTPRHLYNLLEKYELPKNKWALKKLVEEERGS